MAERFVGLDIGTSAVRAAEVVSGSGSRATLENYGQVGIPVGTVVDGEIRDPHQVVLALNHLWRDGGFTERRVHLGIAGLRAITRELDMPPVPPEDLDGAVLFKAEQVVPFPVEQTAISSKVIAEYTDEEGNPQIRVLIAAAHREVIDSVVSVAEEAGLDPVGIDLNTAALVRALYDPSFNAGPEAIVSIGAGLTMVVVHQAGQLQFVRTIDMGGNNVTSAVAGALDIPLPDAEAVKRHLAMPGTHDTRAQQAVDQAVEELVEEIHNSIRFFSTLPGRGAPARLLVTGTATRTVGFLPRLQREIELPVLPASPLSLLDNRMPVSSEESAQIEPTLAVSIGLALSGPGGKPFNLLPPEVTVRQNQRRLKGILVKVGVGFLCLIILLSAWKLLQTHSEEHKVSSLKAQLATITSQIKKYDKAAALKQQVTNLETSLTPLISTEVDWLVVFNQIGLYIPTTSTLGGVTLSFTGTKVSTAKKGTTKTKSSATAKTKIIGTGSTTVAVHAVKATNALHGFVQFNQGMSGSKVLTFTAPRSAIQVNGTTYKFSTTFTINTLAHSERLQIFSGTST